MNWQLHFAKLPYFLGFRLMASQCPFECTEWLFNGRDKCLLFGAVHAFLLLLAGQNVTRRTRIMEIT